MAALPTTSYSLVDLDAMSSKLLKAAQKKPSLIAILTPAKTLTTRKISKAHYVLEKKKTKPRFPSEIETLSRTMRDMTRSKLGKTLKVSDKIRDLNFERFKSFETQEERPGILYFDGAAHRGFDAWTLSEAEQISAQKRVRIISGLYGLLRPYDEMRAYRLEMGTKLNVADTFDSLYEFWGNKIANGIADDLSVENGSSVLVNCCSKEYGKAVVKSDVLKKRGVRVVTCEFPGPSVYAKRARGMMCRFIATNEIEDVEHLKSFVGYETDAHYTWVEDKKKKDTLVFHRRAGAPPPTKPKRARR